MMGAMAFVGAVGAHANVDAEVEGMLAYLKSVAGMPGAPQGLARPPKPEVLLGAPKNPADIM